MYKHDISEIGHSLCVLKERACKGNIKLNVIYAKRKVIIHLQEIIIEL